MKKILAELRSIVLAKPLDFLLWRDGKLELKELNDIPRRSRGAVARIERNTTGIKVVFHDKLKAAELLMRYDRQQLPAEENNLLEAILESTNQPLEGQFTIEELEDYLENDNALFITEGD